MANLQRGTILPEICLYIMLCWLAGGSYLDITDVAGIIDHPSTESYGRHVRQYVSMAIEKSG
jgi:hypothetical protein